jgi:hypothetical protein
MTQEYSARTARGSAGPAARRRPLGWRQPTVRHSDRTS